MSAPVLLAAARMGRRLTAPFGRGADTRELPLAAGAESGVALVVPYDFADHEARFDRAAEPRYVLAAARDVAEATTVTATYAEPGRPEATATVALPAGTVAGTSFALDLPASATGRVTRLAVLPVPADAGAEACWRLTALLGTMATLLWVVGAERDVLLRHAARTAAQRHLPSAAGPSLDLIGADLGVPRFPPLPYGFDAGTVALYHLNDAVGAAVLDATGQYPGRTGHPGTVVGAVQPGAAGRYGHAFRFGAGAAVEVAGAPVFDIPADGSATVECFVQPDPSAADGPVLARQADPGGTGPGWSLAVGEFGRGLPRNVRLAVGDGTAALSLFADVSLPVDGFSHLAGVLDRAAGRLTLYVDGVPRASQPLGRLGAVAATAPLRIGPGGGAFRGVLDEVRISAVARADFHPALGEADEHYRRRLRLFRRWSLPTPANLAAMLNELVGPVGGQPDPLVVDDGNATVLRGTRLVRVCPVRLLPGECMDAAGRRRVDEAVTVGTAAAEELFDPDFLLRHDRPGVDYDPPPARELAPGERPPDCHLVQLAVAGPLDRLVDLAVAEAGPSGRLRVLGGYDPRATDLRATGRAVLVTHATVPPERLAALAHRAGFGYVAHRAGGQVYAAAAPADYLAVDLTPAGGGPTDLDAGTAATLSVRPPLPPDAYLSWHTVPCGAGRAAVAGSLAPGSPGGTATLTALAPGTTTVTVTVTRGHRSVSAQRTVRIGLATLPPGQTIAADGTLGAPASVVGEPDEYFHPAFLVRHDDPRVSYAGESAHFMQPAVAQRLDALLAELDRRAVPGLTVVAGYRPGDDLAGHGRLLDLRHGGLVPAALAGLAHAAGFGHVELVPGGKAIGGTVVRVRQGPGPLVTLAPESTVDGGGILELDEGTSVDLSVRPAPTELSGPAEPGPVDSLAPRPVPAIPVPPPGPIPVPEPPEPPGPPLPAPEPVPGPAPGVPPRLGWACGAFDDARASLGSSTQPDIRLRADSAGLAWVQASYLLGDRPAPYTVRVRLRPELSGPDTVLSKDQYDLLMNVLTTLHPVGVELNTSDVREHTVEVRGDPAEANPDYTYPKFRVRGGLPRWGKDRARG